MTDKSRITIFKEKMVEGMKQNFLNDGGLTPFIFFLEGDEFVYSIIPNDSFTTNEKKIELINGIREYCTRPTVMVGGLITEAISVSIDTEDEDMLAEIISGRLNVADMGERVNNIVMIFSTPEKEELIGYVVNPEDKTIISEMVDGNDDDGKLRGMFSGMFQWTQN